MPKRLEPVDPREWLRRAQSSLLHAKSKVDGVYLEDLCFDAQQAAEKAIKAVLVLRQIRFPYVHDIDMLLTALEHAGDPIPEPIRNAVTLTPFAVEARYPSVAKEVTDRQYEDALDISTKVVDWATKLILPPNSSSEEG